ncbi:hypothetical protein HYU11_00730 [Candidatus Woesearchaeota archaeon]|nr:hypothetical protein [Candidatus Woesearchaeota archaeon]
MIRLRFEGDRGFVEDAPEGYVIHSLSKDPSTEDYYLVLEAGKRLFNETEGSERFLLYVGEREGLKRVELAAVKLESVMDCLTFVSDRGETALIIPNKLFSSSSPRLQGNKRLRLEGIVNPNDTAKERLYGSYVWRNPEKEMDHRLSQYGGYDPVRVRNLVDRLRSCRDLDNVSLVEKMNSLDTMIKGDYMGDINFLTGTRKDVEEKVKGYYQELGKRVERYFENVRVPWVTEDGSGNMLFIQFSGEVESGKAHKKRYIEVALTQRKG